MNEHAIDHVERLITQLVQKVLTTRNNRANTRAPVSSTLLPSSLVKL